MEQNLMIRFIIGFSTIVAAVVAVGGSIELGSGILLATAGTIIMLWGISSMNEGNLG
jgi:hypothetical protein